MSRKNTPPSYGDSDGPRIVACQWHGSSPTGPAEHWAGGSLAMSLSSLLILLSNFDLGVYLVCYIKSLYFPIFPTYWFVFFRMENPFVTSDWVDLDLPLELSSILHLHFHPHSPQSHQKVFSSRNWLHRR